MGEVDREVAVETIRTAIDSGITLLDTAQAYRTSENVVGDALKDGYRERCFLATKVSGRYSPKDIRSAIENSLKQLDVEYVDLYQVHSWNPAFRIEQTMETMAKLQEEGKTRYIGVSNFNAEQMYQALQTTRFQSSQPRYNLFDREIESVDIPFCGEEGIGILVHSPLAKGLLTGRYAPGHTFPEGDERAQMKRFRGDLFTRYIETAERIRDEVAEPKGISMVQCAIAWILRHPEVTSVLVGAKNADQVKEHVGAAEISFEDDERERIEVILTQAP
jgi:aryl-alcohol dehydrogenase-like predicted oxidoreductase